MIRRRAAFLALAPLLAVCGAAPAQEGPGVTLGALLDLRVASAPRTTSFLDGGLGKVRYGGEGGDRRFGFHVAQASVVLRAALSPQLFAHVQANVDPESYERSGLSGVDLVEAFAAWRPDLTRTLSLRLKGGVFFPPVSLENDGFAWSTTRTLTPSAIDAWIGEEVRVTGLESTLVVLLPRGDLALGGAVFGWNDPDGSLLAWRGWALHDRQSGWTDRVPLAPIGDLFADFPRQAPFTAPFREVDGRAGWYASASWRAAEGTEARALYLDDGGDGTSLERGQYSWKTRFGAAGVRLPLGDLELLAQGIEGRAEMGYRYRVDVVFRAAYLLASWRAGRHRFSARGDLFRNSDRVNGDYAEHGWALTAAWLFAATDHLRVGLEALRVDSTRPGRYEVGEAPRAIETLVQASLRLRF